MKTPTIVLIACLTLPGWSEGSTTNPKETSVRAADPLPLPTKQQGKNGAREQFRVTDDTEVLLDGKPCKFRQVPASATILHMDVAADGKSVLKIHFRSK
ncbi:MAG: hypothetical protein K2R98_18455 [Gemmataceae bacterium]|nr:hypothetical protein [Gemmataceae bacterium]